MRPEDPDHFKELVIQLPAETYIRLSRVASRSFCSREEFARAAVFHAIEKMIAEERTGANIMGAIVAFTEAFQESKGARR